MPHEVIWTEPALDDLAAIREYLRQFNPAAANRIARELARVADDLEAFPSRGRPVAGGRFREMVTVFPYIIRYRVAGGQVFILRIRHGAQRPAEP